MNVEKLERLRARSKTLHGAMSELSSRRFALREEISRLASRSRELGEQFPPPEAATLERLTKEMQELERRYATAEEEWRPLCALVKTCDEFIAGRRPN